MKSLLTITSLSLVLLTFGLFVASQVSKAQQKKNLAAVLLELPAPPPGGYKLTEEWTKRPDDFFSRSKPPAEDAPIEDLLQYWQKQNEIDRASQFVAPMSARTAERLFAEIEKEPETAASLVNSLPDTPETAAFVKKIYEQLRAAENDDEKSAQRENYEEGDGEDGNPAYVLSEWLKYHTDYFIDALVKEAQTAAETEEYVTNQDELLALARVDWDRARPILERMLENEKQPVSRALARWAFYHRAISENDLSEAAKWREQLQASVENKNAKPGERDLAMDALVREGDFAGRDDWYYSLLSDETLYDLRVGDEHYTGLTTMIMHSPEEKYTAKMLELLKSDNAAVRSAAVINLTTLLDGKNEQIVRALLPWLENPEWARETDKQRQVLIRALENFKMPESVPGLIALLNEKGKASGALLNDMSDGARMSNRPTVLMNTNQNYPIATGNAAVENFPYRSAAIAALANQKDARAVPALRAVLPQVENYERQRVINALYACGGYTTAEQVEAVETAAETTIKMRLYASEQQKAAANMVNAPVIIDEPMGVSGGTMRIGTAEIESTARNLAVARLLNPSEEKAVLGSLLVQTKEVADDLAFAVAARMDETGRKNPALADALRAILLHWDGAAVNAILLGDLKNGKNDAGAVVKLLSVRKDLREKQPNDVYSLREGAASNAQIVGTAACLLEDANEYDRILAGAANNEEKTAMLACARLIRARLPIAKVAENLRAENKTLALAAERYLESEDSPEARRIVLSLHPNEAKILGATTAFLIDGNAAAPSDDVGEFLPALFASAGDEPSAPLPLYMLTLNNDEISKTEKQLQKEVKEDERIVGVYSYDKNYVRIYADGKAVFSWDEDDARYRERTLDASEFNRLKSVLAAQRADELPPFLTDCSECQDKELLMLGRAGGRRVFYRSQRAPELFAELDKSFKEMREPSARLHYWLEKSVPGLEILFADENLQARAVWKNADDLRIAVEDAAQGKRIERELAKIDRAESEREDYDYEKGEEISQKRRAARSYENFSWRKILQGADADNCLGEITAQPSPLEFIPARDRAAAQPIVGQWKARSSAGVEIRAGDVEGLFRVARGQAVKIGAGNYTTPVASPDGRWAIARKFDEEGLSKLVRVNLATGKEFVVKPPDKFPFYEALAFVAPLNKFLIASGIYGDVDYMPEAAANRKFFLLDAGTGILQPAKGELRPLAQQSFRPLQQASSGADEFWAAIPDTQKNETQVGIFNTRTFQFKSKLTVPRIKFDSMDVWADERENKIYFVYQGHLLALPLPPKA